VVAVAFLYEPSCKGRSRRRTGCLLADLFGYIEQGGRRRGGVDGSLGLGFGDGNGNGKNEAAGLSEILLEMGCS